MAERERDPVGPGRLLLHPLALLAIGGLILNDHVLKGAAPGAITGKLSDVAGLVFFPLLLAQLIAACMAARGARAREPQAFVPAAIATTIVGFTVVKATSVGAAAFGWLLGAGQWLILAGPVRGVQLHPAAVVVDPTDLLAVPAVLAAAWIARPPPIDREPARPRRPSLARSAQARRWIGTFALVVAGLASLGTSKGAPQQSAHLDEAFVLSRDHPVVVRHVSFEVQTDDPTVSSVALLVSADTAGVDDDGLPVYPGQVWTSVIADGGAEVASTDDWTYASPSLDLTASCSRGCRSGATLIIRRADDPPGADLPIALGVSLLVSGDFDREAVAATLSLRADDERASADRPSTLAARAEGTLRVGQGHPVGSQDVTLRVEPAALVGPLDDPLVGHLQIGVSAADATGLQAWHRTTVRLDDDDTLTFLPDRPIDIEWLSRCRAGQACAVRIRIETLYDDAAPEPRRSGEAWTEVTWSVEARLEAFDDRELPPGSLTLSER